MNIRWACCSPMWIFIALLVSSVRIEAQTSFPGGPMQAMPGAMPSGPMGMPPGSMMGPMGPMGPGAGYDAMSVGYMDGGAGAYGGEIASGGCDCPECAGGGGQCSSLLDGPLRYLLPYPDGGPCAPRWFDLSVEAMWLQRDDSGRNQQFSSVGQGGPIVLQSNQLNFEERPSFRFIGCLQFGAGSNIEFNYFGLFHWFDSQQVNSATDDLYSRLSQYGTAPPGGFLEESQGAYHRIEYGTTFDNFEVNYRKRWEGPGCRFQGSWLFGVRYFKLDEDFNFITVSTRNQAMMKYAIDVNNSLTGGQLGGDTWVTIIPGLRAGAEFKAGVYGNHASQSSVVDFTSGPQFNEAITANDVGFVTDASLMATWRLSQQFNLKFAYNFLYVNGVALAPENFNANPAGVFNTNGPIRAAQLNQHGDAFWHGASGGLEFAW